MIIMLQKRWMLLWRVSSQDIPLCGLFQSVRWSRNTMMHPPFYSALIHSEKQDIQLVSSTSKPWFKPREIPLFSPLLCTLKTANTVQISSCAYCMLLILPRLPHAFCFPALLRPSSPWVLIDWSCTACSKSQPRFAKNTSHWGSTVI